jgi:hypothetical protein|tara:strand:+ start:1240 stop:1524 length:285 start_codon:yes stop_codon:yes gene_type:complete
MNKPITNDEDLAIRVSECTGLQICKEDVASYKGWVFVRDLDWPDEIDCYNTGQNPWECAWEPYSGRAPDQTPLGTTDINVLNQTIESLEISYRN